MQRYFVKEELSVDQTYEMDNEHRHHIVNVMRSNVDDVFTVVDNQSQAYLVKLNSIDPLTYQVVEKVDHVVEMPVNITIFSPLLKGDKMDIVIQKSTELGAHAFVLYKAERSVVRLNSKKESNRLERFEKIATEAAEQSKRLHIPTISFDGTLKEIDFSSFDTVLFAYENNNFKGQKIRDVLRDTDAKNIAFIFGPEGGFTNKEVDHFKDANNITLGPRILRAETAPLYALSAIASCIE